MRDVRSGRREAQLALVLLGLGTSGVGLNRSGKLGLPRSNGARPLDADRFEWNFPSVGACQRVWC